MYPIRALIEPRAFTVNALPRELPDEFIEEEESEEEESDGEGDGLAPNQDNPEVDELADHFQEQANI